MRRDDDYEYEEVELKEGDDRHAIASSWEIHGWVFVAYAHSPATLIFRKRKQVIEA